MTELKLVIVISCVVYGMLVSRLPFLNLPYHTATVHLVDSPSQGAP